MICSKCGTEIPEGSLECPICENVSEDIPKVAEEKPSKSDNKAVIKVVCVIIAIVVIAIIVTSIQKNNLKQELLRDWSEIDGSDGTYITRILDFSDDEVEYRIETGYSWLDTTLAEYEYKVISGNKIEITQYGVKNTFTIEFDDDKSMMIVTPAITSTDSKEYWFNHD